MLSFGNAWRSFLANAFNFEGRSSRAAFWWIILSIVISGTTISLISPESLFASGGTPPTSLPISAAIFVLGIALLLPLLSLTVRRFRDAGVSPIFIVIAIIVPISYQIYKMMFNNIESAILGDNYNILDILFLFLEFSDLAAVLFILIVCCVPSRFSKYLKYPMDNF